MRYQIVQFIGLNERNDEKRIKLIKIDDLFRIKRKFIVCFYFFRPLIICSLQTGWKCAWLLSFVLYSCIVYFVGSAANILYEWIICNRCLMHRLQHIFSANCLNPQFTQTMNRFQMQKCIRNAQHKKINSNRIDMISDIVNSILETFRIAYVCVRQREYYVWKSQRWAYSVRRVFVAYSSQFPNCSTSLFIAFIHRTIVKLWHYVN